MQTVEEKALQEAIAWRARLASGEAADDDLTAFRQWLAADPYHPVAAEFVEMSWNEGGEAAVTADRALALPHRHIARAALAAGGLAAAASVAFLLTQTPNIQHYQTGVGETRQIALEDGSRIVLNAASGVTVRFGWLARDLSLDRGDAEFKVAHSRWRPFTVSAPHVRVRAVGTRFAISDYDDASLVTLSEGVVQLRNRQDGVVETMTAGHRVLTRGDAAISHMEPVDPQVGVDWRQGLIALDDSTLEGALSRFSRYSSIKVVLAEKSLGGLRVSGVYQTRDLDPFLNAVARIYRLQVTRGPSGERIIGR